MFGHDGSMWFGGGFMWLFWILLIVIVVLAVKFVSTGNPTSGSGSDESAMSILKKRYAKGEIDEEEYKRRAREIER